MNKEQEVARLLGTPRIFYTVLKPQNSVVGLYDLIKGNVTNTTKMVEVGCFQGVSSELFAIHCDTIHCVDPWESYAEIDAPYIIEAERRFDILCGKYTNINKIKASSVEASKMFKDRSLDGVYIDAAHDYENFKQDLGVWLPKVKIGGFMAGHDIVLKPVRKRVDEVFGFLRYKTYSDTSWITKVVK